MPLSEEELANKLRDFAKRFVTQHSYEDAVKLAEADDYVTEYHNEDDPDHYYQVEASTLERSTDENGPYVLFVVSAMDMRPGGSLGSANQPMCCTVSISANGTSEFGVIGNSAVPESIVRDF